jgi:hypothetical protein
LIDGLLIYDFDVGYRFAQHEVSGIKILF